MSHIKPSGRDIEEARRLWGKIARQHGWYSEPFYIQVWVDKQGIIQDSVSTRNLTEDIIIYM